MWDVKFIFHLSSNICVNRFTLTMWDVKQFIVSIFVHGEGEVLP